MKASKDSRATPSDSPAKNGLRKGMLRLVDDRSVAFRIHGGSKTNSRLVRSRPQRKPCCGCHGHASSLPFPVSWGNNAHNIEFIPDYLVEVQLFTEDRVIVVAFFCDGIRP